MATVEPGPQTWTLRFKHGKETTVLHVDPLQAFSDIKTELLVALRATHPSGRLQSGARIAHDASEVMLAKSASANEYGNSEWHRLQTAEDSEAEVDGDENKKSGKTKARSSGLTSEFCPKAAELRDGSVLAYRFLAEGDRGNADGEVWHVVQPSLDDTNLVEEADEDGKVPDMDFS